MPGDKTALSSTSPTFAFLEYFLQISLHGTTARIQNAWALSNPHLTVQFEKRCKDMLILDSWVDTAVLSPPNTEKDILNRGFLLDAGTSGFKFPVGELRVQRSGDVGQLLLCKVGVGRSYYADEAYAKIGNLNEGYDSFYVAKPKTNPDGSPSDDYYHEYYVKDANQILPVYLITFTYDEEKEKLARQKTKCDNCEMADACFYCPACPAYLCEKCDQEVHSANKFVGRHVRNPVGQGPEVFGYCRTHPEKTVEFFCPTCHIPVCVYCKMVGHHSSGEAQRHKLVSISEAYSSVLENSKDADPILQSRRSAIENQIARIHAQSKSIEKNSADVKHKLEEQHKKAIHELKLLTKKKMTVLKSDECELYRQLGEIERLEEFLKYQQSGNDKTQFLLNWGRHVQLRGELHAFRFFRDTIDVHPDIKFSGKLEVHTDETIVPTPEKPSKKSPSRASSVSNSMRPPASYDPISSNVPRVPVSDNRLSMAMPRAPFMKSSTLRSVRSNAASEVSEAPSLANARERLTRRTSEFFAETLNALEIGKDETEYTGSEYTYAETDY